MRLWLFHKKLKVSAVPLIDQKRKRKEKLRKIFAPRNYENYLNESLEGIFGFAK